jgi:hypothetical protein
MIKKFLMKNKSTRNLKNNLKETKKKNQKKSFISITNGIFLYVGIACWD